MILDKRVNSYMGVRSLRKGGGDLSREVWHNKCLWCKNDKNMRAEEAKPL